MAVMNQWTFDNWVSKQSEQWFPWLDGLGVGFLYITEPQNYYFETIAQDYYFITNIQDYYFIT